MHDLQHSDRSQHTSEQTTQKKAIDATSDFEQPSPIVSPRHILNLQRTIGNQAVMRRIAPASRSAIQRASPETAPPAGAPAPATDVPAAAEPAPAAENNENLSGAHWVQKANDNGWDRSQNISDLDSSFSTKVANFKAALETAGASISIDTTRRSAVRSWLMHYAWTISNGGAAPTSDPHNTGIIWDHGTPQATKDAATAMKNAFGMAQDAALDSLHIQGKAIDWTITWSGDLTIKNANGDDVVINTEPRHGGDKNGAAPTTGNTTLHSVGATYGVIKLSFDEPHWSTTGN